MAKLKIFTKMKDFKPLEDFYKEPIQGAYVTIEDKFERSYCKCGKVSASINDMCDCGANKFIKLRNIDYWLKDGILDTKTIVDTDEISKTITISLDVLKVDKSDRTQLNVQYEHVKVISFKNKDYTIYNSAYLNYVRRVVLRGIDELQSLVDYACLFNYRCQNVCELNVDNAIIIIDRLNKCPKFMLDADTMRFKYLANAVVSNIGFENVPNKSFEDVLKSKKVDTQYFAIFNNFCKDSNYYYSDYTLFERTSSFGSKITFSEYLNDGVAKYSKDSKHIWNTLFHHLNSGAINLGEFVKILEEYNSLWDYSPTTFKAIMSSSSTRYKFIFDFEYGYPLRNIDEFVKFWSKSYIDLFPIYLKENLYGKPTAKMISSFIKDLYMMKENSIPIDEDSLKLKNFNYNLNERSLSNYLGIPSEKTEVFLDTFDKNPLASISLLKNRRQLTKQQMDEYMKMFEE